MPRMTKSERGAAEEARKKESLEQQHKLPEGAYFDDEGFLRDEEGKLMPDDFYIMPDGSGLIYEGILMSNRYDEVGTVGK